MCSKEEVREAIRSEAPSKLPPIMLNMLGTGIIMLLSWLAWDAHQKDFVIADMKTVSQVALANLTGEIKLLQANFYNLEKAALSKTNDRYYGKDAIARALLVDERFNTTHTRHDMSQSRQDRTDKRLDKIEEVIKEHHDGRNL